MDVTRLLKSIVVGFFLACFVSIIEIVFVVTAPLAAGGFIPTWVICTYLCYREKC